jgi:hypothetical protein
MPIRSRRHPRPPDRAALNDSYQDQTALPSRSQVMVPASRCSQAARRKPNAWSWLAKPVSTSAWAVAVRAIATAATIVASPIPFMAGMYPPAPSQFKVLENRLRRAAERQGLRLHKSRAKDPRSIGYGKYKTVERHRQLPGARSAWERLEDVGGGRRVPLRRPVMTVISLQKFRPPTRCGDDRRGAKVSAGQAAQISKEGWRWSIVREHNVDGLDGTPTYNVFARADGGAVRVALPLHEVPSPSANASPMCWAMLPRCIRRPETSRTSSGRSAGGPDRPHRCFQLRRPTRLAAWALRADNPQTGRGGGSRRRVRQPRVAGRRWGMMFAHR